MVSTVSMASFLPGVKCSNCGVEVQLALMGEHICSASEQADPATENRGSNSVNSQISRVASQTKRSSSKRAGRLRVDSSAANRPFLRPNELTPANSGTFPQASDPYGRNSPAHRPQQSGPRIAVPQSPPSPEHSNLDCAFPPFHSNIPRTAPLLEESRHPSPQSDNEYAREHAEPYNGARRPAPPPRHPSSRYSQARSAGLKSGRRSGFIGSLPASASQLSGAKLPPMRSQAEMAQALSPGVEEEPPPIPSKGYGPLAPGNGPASSGTKPDSVRGRSPYDRPLPPRPGSPNRSQTDPSRDQEGTLRTGRPRLGIRSSSQPAPKSPTGRVSDRSDSSYPRSAQIARPSSRTPTPPNQDSPFHTRAGSHLTRPMSQRMSSSPPRLRRGPARSPSHSHMRVNLSTSSPSPLPAHHVSSRSEFINSSTAPLPDAASPARAPLSTIPPDSPTDPLCFQGRLSPLPQDTSNGPRPFPMTRSSSASSPASSKPSLQPRRDMAAPHKGICRGCSHLIMAGEKSVSSKDGQLTGRYHKQCFACHTCHVPFQTADFYVHDDLPYCGEHYHAINGSVCNGCGQGIEGQYLKATTMKGKKAEKFHPACLKCSACHISLHDDYYEWMGRVYCEQDAYRMAGIQTQSSSSTGSLLSSRPGPGPSSAPFPSRSPSPMSRPGGLGLPSGPRAGMRPGPVANGGPNGFFSPHPGARPQLPAGIRFPERRTTRLMMI